MPLGLLVALILPMATAQVPQKINYQGRVAVGEVNFDGTGQFKFALVDGGVNLSQPATATLVLGGGGEVTGIDVVSGGSGYTDSPEVTIVGDGTGATASATVDGGVVTGITVTAGGADYTAVTTVSIAPPPPAITVTTAWSNDGTSTTGNEPLAAVAIPVTHGLYSTALADVSLGMTPFNPAVFDAPLNLRVWFDDGVHGFQLLTPDQPLATVPYAFRADMAATVPDAAIGPAQLADGAITSAKLAAGAVTVDQLNFTGSPSSGQVLGFDGANLTWLTPAVGGGGGGSLTLPYSGLAAATGALFSINNTGATGDSWGIYGHSETNVGMFGQTHGNARAGVLGRNDGPTGVGGAGVFGYSSTGGAGVLAISEGGEGLWASTNAASHSAVYGQTHVTSSTAGRFDHYGATGTALTGNAQGGAGVHGTSTGYYGVYGETSGAGSAGVTGYSSASNAAGVKGSSGGNGPAVYAISGVGGGVGVSTISYRNDGVDASTAMANKSAVFAHTAANGAFGVLALSTQGTGIWAKTEKSSEPAGYFWNSAGGDAIRASGKTDLAGDLTVHGLATVRVLTISNGVDVAEPFAMRDDEDYPKGSVMVISDERPGELQLSSEEYDTRVAGIISGANGINPGLQLTQKGVNDSGGQPVALSGRVYCRADASFGNIKAGDLLTTSSNPGHARKVTDPGRAQGAVLGKAMSALDEGTGYVLVLVTLQ